MTKRGRRLLFGILAASAATAGGAAVVSGSALLADQPGTAGEDFWAEETDPAPPILQGSARRLTSGLNAPTDTSFELEWPRSRGTTYFFVACDQGKVEIAGPGFGTGIQCNGRKTVLTAIGSHADRERVRVTVDRPQRRRWGAALYR